MKNDVIDALKRDVEWGGVSASGTGKFLVCVHAKVNLLHVGIGVIPETCLLQMTIQASQTDRNSSAKSSLTCRLLGSSSSSLPSTEVSAVPAASASSLWV